MEGGGRKMVLPPGGTGKRWVTEKGMSALSGGYLVQGREMEIPVIVGISRERG